MIRFDTRNKKPKVWNIAILTLLTAVLTAVLVGMEVTSLRAVEGVLCLYLLLTVAFLLRAFVRQLEYNPYSYNTIMYTGFALFVVFVLIVDTVLTVRTLRNPGLYFDPVLPKAEVVPCRFGSEANQVGAYYYYRSDV